MGLALLANGNVAASVELTQIICGSCGGTYAIAERVREHHYEHAGTWHCPYCQTSWGYLKSEAARVREQLEAEKRRHLDTLARANQAEAERAKAERKLKRVQRGVCPCCSRTFVNLARHMATKHPDEAPTK